MKYLKNFLIIFFTVMILHFWIEVVNPITHAYGQTLITTVTIREKQGQATINYPLTFAHVFKQGQVANNVSVRVNGTLLPTQCDVKRRYADGSVRHAVISVILPTLYARQDLTLELVNGGTPANSGQLTKAQILATDVQSLIGLTNLSGSGYSGSLTANLRQAITNATTLTYWLKGAVSTEILVEQKLNNSLNAAWEVRFYPGWNGIRISNAIENVEADFRGNVAYAVTIQQGNATPASVYTKAAFTHNYCARWRKVFWLGNRPPEVEIRYNFTYLIATGHVMNYDTSLVAPENILASQYNSWLTSQHDIMDAGRLNPYFPSTGDRAEIGVLPAWTVYYLYSMDNRMKEIMLNYAELASGVPIHYRESNPAKSFYGHIVSINDRPTIWLGRNDFQDIAAADRLPAEIGSIQTIWSVDRAHQASFAYIPYLVTGEYYYLEELYYWSGYNLGASNDDPNWGRDRSRGLFRDQVRGEAWAIRNLADAAALAPDADRERAYFEEKLRNNLTTWEQETLHNTNASPLHIWGYVSCLTADGGRADEGVIGCTSSPTGRGSGVYENIKPIRHLSAPWQDDFMLLALKHLAELGYPAQQLHQWLGEHSINRFSHPDFNPYNGAAYNFPATYVETVQTLNPYYNVSTWKHARDAFINQPTTLPRDDYPFSYRYVALGALSTVTEYQVVQNLAAGGTAQATGQQAYNWLRTHVYNIQFLREDPRWAFVPRNDSGPLFFLLWTM